MGWLELLPLMRRLLPMLSQLTPMLESMLAGRMGGRAEAERTQAAVAEIGISHAGLLTALEQQRSHLATLADDLRASHAANTALQSQVDGMDRRLALLTNMAKKTVTVLVGLLLLCLVLLCLLLLRHR